MVAWLLCLWVLGCVAGSSLLMACWLLLGVLVDAGGCCVLVKLRVAVGCCLLGVVAAVASVLMWLLGLLGCNLTGSGGGSCWLLIVGIGSAFDVCLLLAGAGLFFECCCKLICWLLGEAAVAVGCCWLGAVEWWWLFCLLLLAAGCCCWLLAWVLLFCW